jgi:hypothetical protein
VIQAMPSFQLTPVEASLLLGFLAVWAIFLFGGLLIGEPDAQAGPARRQRIPQPARMLSSLMLVAAAWVWLVVSLSLGEEVRIAVAFLFAVGMTLGFVGDLFLADLLVAGDWGTLGGIMAFSAGHVAYILGLLVAAGHVGAGLAELALSIAVFWLIGGLAWYAVVARSHQRRQLHLPALPYSLVLATTAGLSVGLAAVDPVFTLVAVGATLFLISDFILAYGMFRNDDVPYLHDAVWLTYGPGQMLIVYGLALQTTILV